MYREMITSNPNLLAFISANHDAVGECRACYELQAVLLRLEVIFNIFGCFNT